MFKRKCHETGDAIRVFGTLVVMCKCVTHREIDMLIKLIEGQNKNV